VVSAGLAFVGAGGSGVQPPGTAGEGSGALPATGAYLAAVRPDGTVAWRRPGGGTPLYADDEWVLTHDRLGDRVRIALHAAVDGSVRWTVSFPAPAVVDESTLGAGGPPPGDPGRPPPRDPGRPPGGGPGGPGGPPPYSHSWNYTQAVITGGFVVVRDASEIRSLRMAGGTEAWADTSPRPVTDLALAGDRVLVAAERVRARRADDGSEQWTVEMPGARLGVASQRVVVGTPDGRVSAHDLDGNDVWRAEVPDDARFGIPDRLVVDGDQVIVTMAPPPRATGQADTVDVVAFAL
jgi:outer membrane protein assembly factor BamB